MKHPIRKIPLLFAGVGMLCAGVAVAVQGSSRGVAAELKDLSQEEIVNQAQTRRALMDWERQALQSLSENMTMPEDVSDGIATTIHLRMLLNGDVKSIRIVKGSGDAMFDMEIIRAIQRSNPLPAVNDELLMAGVRSQGGVELRLTPTQLR